MANEKDPALEFLAVASCANPMETEIFPATLREKDIPHRTQWDSSGSLLILVPREWVGEAQAALAGASRVFFSEEPRTFEPRTVESMKSTAGAPGSTPIDAAAATDPPAKDQAQGTDRAPEVGPVRDGQPAGPDEADDEDDEEEESGLLFSTQQSLFGQAHRRGTEARVRAVWPAWVLAAIPGLGLGHLYAGKIRIFVQLLLLTSVTIGYYVYSGHWFVLLAILVSWGADLGFAAYHIKEHNLKALEYQKQAAEEEKRFLDSL
jgi:hypothetical protein